MYLTPLDAATLDRVIERFGHNLGLEPLPRAAWRRIAATCAHIGVDCPAWHAQAVALTQDFGMQPLDEPPALAFSWDGSRVRTGSEASVVLHEVAHFQLASPFRRLLPDFGLGAGPETGFAEAADRARIVNDEARETEEQMASLLGILWEVELGQPAILAFHEQNWLEGAERPGTAGFFSAVVRRLAAAGLIDHEARPLRKLRLSPDDESCLGFGNLAWDLGPARQRRLSGRPRGGRAG